MTRRSFKSELLSLIFSLRTLITNISNPIANNVLDDFSKVLQYSRVRKEKRYLIWGLLIGRSVDSFTMLSVRRKTHSRRESTFNERIIEICGTGGQPPLTNDPTIKDDLDEIRKLRNDLFHNAGRHLNDKEMKTFLFKSTRCLQQLILDL